jgi:hypothetical protein
MDCVSIKIKVPVINNGVGINEVRLSSNGQSSLEDGFRIGGTGLTASIISGETEVFIANNERELQCNSSQQVSTTGSCVLSFVPYDSISMIRVLKLGTELASINADFLLRLQYMTSLSEFQVDGVNLSDEFDVKDLVLPNSVINTKLYGKKWIGDINSLYIPASAKYVQINSVHVGGSVHEFINRVPSSTTLVDFGQSTQLTGDASLLQTNNNITTLYLNNIKASNIIGTKAEWIAKFPNLTSFRWIDGSGL